MNRRCVLLLATTAAMITLAALAAPKKNGLLVLDWAAQAADETPPVAVLIEMGFKDAQATNWSGKAAVRGAKVVGREGYRFRAEDKLVDPDGWQASSHRGLRVPPRQPAVNKLEGIATVGVVLHLADVQPEAALTVEAGDKELGKASVPLRDVLTGQPRPLWDGRAMVRLVSTATPVVTAKTEDDFPAAAYGPDGTLWLAYISYTVRDENRRIEQRQLKEQPADFKALYTPEFADQLFVKYYRGGKWSEPIALTGPKEDLVRCAVAVAGDGTAWVAYSANRKGSHDIYARPIGPNFSPGPEEKVSEGGGPFLSPVMCTDQAGSVWLACQGWTDKVSEVRLFHRGNRNWDSPFANASAGQWYTALSAGPDGQATLAWDMYERGDYDVVVQPVGKGGTTSGACQHVAATSKFEARPSVAFDPQGRLWIAYEEGPEKWGKDYGVLDAKDGNPLYNSRSVRVVCLDKDKLLKPVAELPTSDNRAPGLPSEGQPGPRYERVKRYAYPKIGIDGKGRVWLTYREKFGTRYSTHPGSYWLTFARRLDGDKWSAPVEIHHSDGLLDHRPVLLPHKAGGLRVIHNTDGRYTTPATIDNQIYMSYVDLPGEPVEPKLVPHEAGKKDDKLAQRAKEESDAVKRIRDHRIEAGGKKYQLLRGEFHRHTEISWDGGPDGSLEDMFRYAIDAAGMDWIGNGDHDSGAGREYSWWLIQKFTDAYHVKDRFTPMFTYERSVAYPHGHRNCVFARRGVRTLPRLAEADMEKRVAGVHADDTKMLYRYLKELKGVCAVHTSATSMGTDWRDNDPEVEPFVEIYQGDRMSYEHEGAPRAGYDPKTGKAPANIAGWYPKGYVNLALQKGHRLGFESSSDHWSTHISYCVVLAERHDREAILDGMRKRHTYGATDDIIVDLRSGNHVMGDEFKADAAPALQMNVIGTKPLERIDVMKDSEVVATFKPGKAEFKGDWTDPKPTAGTHYYYIRVQQTDGELAWASPLWIEYKQ
jgi:hypothetical protein